MNLMKKLLRRGRAVVDKTKRRQETAFLEALESRVLLTADGPQVVTAVADNRGQIVITFNQHLDPSTVTTSSVSVFTAGADLTLNTADDVAAPATVTYDDPSQTITVNANLPADTNYWVTVRSTIVKGINGLAVDGEYTGTFPSGNGTPGGNFRIAATNTIGGTRIARFSINGLYINVALATATQLPNSIPDFLFYVNNGKYDATFIHRSTIANPQDPAHDYSIIQGGGFYVASDPIIRRRTPFLGDIPQEPTFSNTQGTLALANQGAPNTTSIQWYFNVTDNASSFDPGYSVIGAIPNGAFLPTLNQLDSYTNHLDLTTTITNVPDSSKFGNDITVGQLNQVPVKSNSLTVDTVDPARDFIIVNRVAIKQALGSMLPFPQPAPAISKPSAAEVAAPIAYQIIGGDPLVAPMLFNTTMPITPAWTDGLDPNAPIFSTPPSLLAQ